MTAIKLTETQKTILKAAVNRPDGAIHPLPERIKGGAVIKVIDSLENKGLAGHGGNPDGDENLPILITVAGRIAIGMEPLDREPADESFEEEVAEAEQALGIAPAAVEPEPETKEDQTPEEVMAPPIEPAMDSLITPQAEPECEPNREILQNEKDAPDVVFMAIAKKHLDEVDAETWVNVRNAMEESYALGFETAKKQPRKSGLRENSKQARMIEMMKHPDGATIEQIAQETGWNSNTVRGAISGTLKKRLGLNITTQRLRNVGPNAKGGYNTYRITEG